MYTNPDNMMLTKCHSSPLLKGQRQSTPWPEEIMPRNDKDEESKKENNNNNKS